MQLIWVTYAMNCFI